MVYLAILMYRDRYGSECDVNVWEIRAGTDTSAMSQAFELAKGMPIEQTDIEPAPQDATQWGEFFRRNWSNVEDEGCFVCQIIKIDNGYEIIFDIHTEK